MNTLEQWVESWLTCPDKDLKLKRWSSLEKRFPRFEKLPAQQGLSKQQSVAAPLLLAVHQRLRNYPVAEVYFWENVLWNVIHPLPDEVVNDLIDRDFRVDELGHLRQTEAVLKRLVPLVSEALLTYAGQLYRDPARSVEEFRDLINQYPTHEWMISSLSHQLPSSPEKKAAFIKIAKANPGWEDIESHIAGVEAYHARMEKERLQREHWSERARFATDTEELITLSKVIWENRVREILILLIRNPATPLEVLENLTEFRGSDSKPVRHEAKNAINRRENLARKLARGH